MGVSSSLSPVDPRPIAKRILVSVDGLSTSGLGYNANYQLGSEIEFAGTTRKNGGYGTVTSATLLDKANVIGAVDLYLFSQPVTPSTDKTSASFSDSDMQYYQGTISFPGPTSLVNNRATSLSAIGLTYQSNSTSLYGYLVTLVDHNTFNSSDDISISLVVYQY